MDTNGSDIKVSWFERPRFRFSVCFIICVLLVGSFINGIIIKDNDFRNHYLIGVYFLQGRPYNLDEHNQQPFYSLYPVGRLVINAMTAWMPYHLTRIVYWFSSIAILILSLKTWHTLVDPHARAHPTRGLVTALLTCLITLRWLVRDLDDCGLQIVLLGILTAAAWALKNRRTVLAGGFIALATTYKTTPALCIPFVLYKRRWREAVWAVVFLVVFNLFIPTLWLGWSKTLLANRMFFKKAQQVVQEIREDPTANGMESPKHANRGLRLAMARFLMHFPPGHDLFIAHPEDSNNPDLSAEQKRPHPLFIQFLDLSPRTAGLIINGVLLAFIGLLAVLFRRSWAPGAEQSFAPGEWAIITALCALLSPLCWGHHLVLMIPAVYVSLYTDIGGHTPKWRRVLMWTAAVLVLAPQREILGRDLWWIIQSYKCDTLAAVIMMVLVLTIPRDRQLAPQEENQDLLPASAVQP
jgi:hypothetical protein